MVLGIMTDKKSSESDSKSSDIALEWKEKGNEKIRKNEDFVGAILCYTRAINADNTQYVYFNNRAVAHMHLKQYEKALNDVEESLKLKENPRAFSRKGAVLCELGYLDSAMEAVDHSLALSPQDTQTLELKEFLTVSIAQANNYINKSTQSMKEFHSHERRSGEVCEEAVSAITKAISLYTSNYRYYNRRAAVYLQSGDLENGIKDCDESLAIHENTRAYSFKAAALGERGHLKEAFSCVDRALELSPTDRLSLKTRQDLMNLQEDVNAEMLRRKGEEAAERNEAVVKQVEDYTYFIHRAREALMLGDYEHVLENCDRSLWMCETCEAYCLKVRALVEFNRIDDGLATVAKSLDVDPEHEESLVLEEWLVKAKSEQDSYDGSAEYDENGVVFDELMVQQQYSLGDSYYAEEGSVLEFEAVHEDAEEHCADENDDNEGDEVEEEAPFARRSKMVEYVELFDEDAHEEVDYQPSEHDDCSRRASVADEWKWRRRSIDEVIQKLPDPTVEDDGVLVESMGIGFKKLITTPEALEVLDDSYQALAHRYSYKVNDLVTTYNLPTIPENNLSGVVVGAKNSRGQYPVFVEFPAHLKKPSITRYYYPENLWSKTRADIKIEKVHNPDKKFQVVSGIYLHHQYKYDRIPAIFGEFLKYSYVIDDTEEIDGCWKWTHSEMRNAIEKLKIKQKTFIHSPEKYDNPVPEFKPYMITFLKVIASLDT